MKKFILRITHRIWKMTETRDDGKPLRTSGWKEWTPADIKVQNYLDIKREFQSVSIAETYKRLKLEKANYELFWANDSLKTENSQLKSKLREKDAEILVLRQHITGGK